MKRKKRRKREEGDINKKEEKIKERGMKKNMEQILNTLKRRECSSNRGGKEKRKTETGNRKKHS